MRTATQKPKSETEISREIAAQLDAMNIYHFRVNSGLTKVRGGWMRGAKTGTPDRFAFPVVFYGGLPIPVMVAIEVKKDTGTVEEAQARTHELIRGMGGFVIVARSKADVETGLRAIEREFIERFRIAAGDVFVDAIGASASRAA